MTCPDENALNAFLSGTLSAAEAQGVEAHLAQCGDCRALVAELVRGRGAPSTPPRARRSTPLSPGEHLGRFEILALVGAGAMGQVYKAYDTLLGRTVALKVLKPGGREASSREGLLLREARAVAPLDHPNVVRVHDAGELDGVVFIAMEYVEGKTLREWLTERPRGTREILEVFHQAALGLHAAHQRQLVHRDFKPDNVLIATDGTVHVSDFGLAHHAGMDGAGGSRVPSDLELELDTLTGEHLGTPAYMAPEQWQGAPPDGRTDQFAFCVCLFEALCGHRPFDRKSAKDLIERIQRGDLETSPRWQGLPPALRSVLQRGLQADPSKRFPDLEALDAALRPLRVPRSRRWLWAALPLVVVLGAAWALQTRLRTQRACREDAQRIERTWSRATAEALQRSFGKAGSSAQVAEQARALIDAYVRDWRAAQDAACAQEAAYGPLACLQRRREELGAVITVLQSGDAAVAQRAVDLVRAIPSPQSCEQQGAWAPLTKDERYLSPAAERAREKLIDARTLLERGHYAEGLKLVEASRAEREGAGSPLLRAEGLDLQGRLQQRLGQLAAAEASFTEAVHLAHAASDTLLAARCEVALAGVIGVQQRKLADGLEWAQRAEASLRAAGGDQRIELTLLHNRGLIQLLSGDAAGATVTLRRGLALKEQALGPDNSSTLTTMAALSEALRRSGELYEAVAYARRAAALTETMLGASHPETATRLTNLSAALIDQGDHAEALDVSRRALAIRQASSAARSPETAASLNNVGLLLVARGLLEEARSHLERALEMRAATLGPEHPDTARGRQLLGIIALREGRWAEAEAHLHAAIEGLEKALGDQHVDLVYPLDALAAVYRARKNWSRARELDERALAIAEASRRDEPEAAFPLLGLAELALAMKDPARAVPLLERALALQESRPRQIEPWADVRFALARALRMQNTDLLRADLLAKEARDAYARQVIPEDPRLQRIEAWLRAHSAR
jgi:tetratricopeptide (TPR) repeat protein